MAVDTTETNLVVRTTREELAPTDAIAADLGYTRSELVRLMLRSPAVQAVARTFPPKSTAASIRPAKVA
jgi:hypothetical protein